MAIAELKIEPQNKIRIGYRNALQNNLSINYKIAEE